MTLTISLATRGRPEQLLHTLRHTVPKLARKDTTLVVSVDGDDQATLDVWSLFPDDERVVTCVAEREDSIGAKWNRCLLYPASVYLPLADYTPYLTEGFDQKILDAAALFPDNIGVVYTHMANGSFPSSQGITHGLVEKLGYMYPPYFPYWFVDHWLDDIAKLIGRISFADVQVQNRKQSPTHEMRDVHFWTTFFDACRLLRRREARAIIDSSDFLEPEWRKEILRRHHPLIEFKSQFINDGVRACHLPDTPQDGGARYERIKAQAMRMLGECLPDLRAEMEKAA